MAHTFDTGEPLAQRTAMRRGAVALLSGLLRQNGGYLEAVEPFGGIVRGYTDEYGMNQVVELMNGRSPGLAIAVGDLSSKAGGMGGFSFKGDTELVVYFYSQNRRGLVEGRLELVVTGDDTIDPGLDIIFQHVEELLVGQYPAAVKSIKQIVPRTEEELLTKDEFTLWHQRYSVAVDRNVDARRNVTQLLTDFYSRVRTTAPQDARPADPADQVPGQIVEFETPLT